MVGHGGSSAGSYLADPTSTIPSHCASIVTTSTLRVNWGNVRGIGCNSNSTQMSLVLEFYWTVHTENTKPYYLLCVRTELCGPENNSFKHDKPELIRRNNA